MEGVGSTEEALLLPAVRCGALPNPSSDIKFRFPETRCHIGSSKAGLWPAAGDGPATGKRNRAKPLASVIPGLELE